MAGSLPRNRGNRSPNRLGSVVSRRLRKDGWNISPAARRYRAQGIFVRGMDAYVSVLVDLGSRSETEALALAETVKTWPQATDVDVLPDDGFAHVTFHYTSG